MRNCLLRGVVLTLTPLLFYFNISAILAQPLPPDTLPAGVFELGEVLITGQSEPGHGESITAAQIAETQSRNVAQALNQLPGLSLASSGSRRESMISIRGYDLRQVPVLMDGIPLYVPYDGYLDLSRFDAANFSSITVTKGYSSLLYGPNALGGAINLVSSKPAASLDVSAKGGVFISGPGLGAYTTGFTAGTKQQKYYVQGNLAYTDMTFATMPENFILVAPEADSKRDNSQSNDLIFGLKAGYTPGKGDEYSLSYQGIQSEKGVPVYLGKNTNNPQRFWQYPKWNKNSAYFHSLTKLSDQLHLKARLYYDSYFNRLKSYDDATYTTQTKKYAFTSIYDDMSAGGALELTVLSLPENTLKLAIDNKYNRHIEYNEGDPESRYTDNTTSLAAENAWDAGAKTRIMAGIGYFIRNGNEAAGYDAASDSLMHFPAAHKGAFDFQAGFTYQLNKDHKAGFSASNRSRFATLKELYSYRLGKALNNPDLLPERAWNFSLDYEGHFGGKFLADASLFLSRLNDVIQQVDNVEPGIYQLQNSGQATFKGIELTAVYKPLKLLTTSAGYTYLSRNNITNPELRFTDVPEHKLSAQVILRKEKNYHILLQAEYNSLRYSTSDGIYIAPDFWLFKLSASKKFLRYLTAELGINNILDQELYLSEGYPEEGRTIYLGLRFDLGSSR